MLLKNKLKEMKTFLNSNNVLANLEERYCYAEDASNLISEKKTPDLVIFVESIEEVQKVIKYAYIHEIPIIPRGAGTNMVGACVCNSGGIVLNFSKMNKILEINPTNMTAKVQPGVILGDLKKEVEKFNLFYPPDPSNFKVSTIGGSIAQSSGGALSFKYGTTKDYVLSLKVVTSDGSLITLGSQVSKNSSGYHLAQLIVGSEGTLGIVVEATLKLIPKPQTKRLVLGYFNNEVDLVKAVDNIISEQVFPASIDFMAKKAIQTIEDFSNCGFNLDYNYLLLVELDGFETSIVEQTELVEHALSNANSKLIQTPKLNETDAIWEARRTSFAASTRLAPDVVSDDIIVPRANLAEVIKLCNEISEKHNINMCLIGHIGDGNLHPQFVLDLDNETNFRNLIACKEELYSIVKNFNGLISAEHGIGLEKKKYLTSILDNKSIEYMKLIKKAFDPKNILNPGKIFDI